MDGSDNSLEEAQRGVPDIDPIVEPLERGADKPPWKEIAPTSSATRHYWAQWNSLRLGGGMLLNKWMTRNWGILLFK